MVAEQLEIVCQISRLLRQAIPFTLCFKKLIADAAP
jgi:hypothetical protein